MSLQKIKISLDYYAVIRQADLMEKEANRLESKIRKLREVHTDLKSQWEGPAATTYLSKLRMLINNMVTTYNEMTSVISTIRRTAKIIKEADELAAENSKNLS